MQRRLPKFGFTSKVGRTTGEVTLSEVALANADVVTLDVLKDADLVSRKLARVKIIMSGKIERAVTVQGIRVTKGARAAIEAAGGKVED
jgi:large subunit ribosomal protein L15